MRSQLGSVVIALLLGCLPMQMMVSKSVFAQTTSDRKAEEDKLLKSCRNYINTQKFQEAVQECQQSASNFKAIGTRIGESKALSNLGIAYYSLGQYQKAIDYLQQSLAIFRQNNDFNGELSSLNNLGNTYLILGQYQKAIENFQQSIKISKQLNDRKGEAISLSNLGNAYLVHYEKDVDFYLYNLQNCLGCILNVHEILYSFQKSLDIFRQIDDRNGEGNALGSLGITYFRMHLYEKAVEFYQQSLAIFKQSENLNGEAYSLGNLGLTYNKLGQHEKAIDFYQRSLAIKKQIGDRSGEGLSLKNLGELFDNQNQPKLAIAFYKQSVNVYESIRKDIKGLSKDEKESYLSTIAQTYRNLADLLLKQGRILEAQQVLELLKVEEIRAYTRNTRAVDDTNGIATNKTETRTIDKHSSLIALGLRVDQCEQQRCPELRQLIKQRQDVANEYDKTVETLVKEIRDRTTNDKAFFDPTLVGKMEEIVTAQPKTILIYHLILKDKIWVLWASKGGITKSIEVPNVGLEKVSSNVLKLRTLLQSPENLEELQKTSQQLREWLIPPQLQAELSANDIKHLVFAPDSVTRYIPMGVLYDGKKYLVENYTIATIISAGLTDTTSRLPNPAKNTSVLAAGLSQPVSGYSPLPNVLTEINAIVRTSDNPNKGIYDGIKLLDSTFTKDSLLDNLGSYAIAHIATHGKFVSGDPDKSFLVLGNGKTLPIPEIKKLRGLSKLHLVVLSACQTALGGTNGDGTEISGISYFFLGIGAKSVIASLWEVSDDSTSLLMQQFYNNLSKSSDSAPVTKSEAMQQAQLSLLQKQITAKDNIQRGNIAVVYRGGSKPTDNYSHPYYWSPFILIGNGL
ncbi:CHAT domain-containing protein [Pseudanabaena galeata UHCC 0370]|uniref:CHAT domain-containing protein n=1 Tax=Pseudanabaena galeata UHCC 0370 TaxID=3110310 RepID=A0ABU5TF28_9CYAN|nr:CHAT domain-containing protein [Pseudanabaena galeata]MEA5476749.1 CHAT domain-containing protein [Pseudanabaena galeata UHCC 0370]